SIAVLNALWSASKGVMSLKTTPGLGQSGISRIRASNNSRSAGASRPPPCVSVTTARLPGGVGLVVRLARRLVERDARLVDIGRLVGDDLADRSPQVPVGDARGDLELDPVVLDGLDRAEQSSAGHHLGAGRQAVLDLGHLPPLPLLRADQQEIEDGQQQEREKESFHESVRILRARGRLAWCC